MHILMFDMGSFTFRDTKEAIEKLGHEVDEMYYCFNNRFEDEFFSERLDLMLKRKQYDCILSINFFPLIAMAAKEHGIPYISWSYDSPLAEQLSDYFNMDTNHIYLFDRSETERFNSMGFTNVQHLPLAVNVERIDKLSFDASTRQKYQADISFVGKIYDSVIDNLMYCADDYSKGYVEALFQAQFRIYGSNFVENSIPDSLLDSLNSAYAKFGSSNITLNKKGLAYAINSQITHVERTLLLELLSENHNVKFYTGEKPDISEKVKICGPVKYFDNMYAVFQNSSLNLCPTLKSIESGIPLRALDILGAGGVLFSNFQPELAECFADGEDVIMYESIEDAVCKADYYLSNKDLLSSIAVSGKQKAASYFSYEDRVMQLLKF